MTKKNSLVLTIAYALLIFSFFPIHSFAAGDRLNLESRVIIYQGVFDDGSHYTIYMDPNQYIDNNDPNIVVSRTFTYTLEVDRKVIPPETINIPMKEGGIEYTGTMSRVSYYYKYSGAGVATVALYKGTLFARI